MFLIEQGVTYSHKPFTGSIKVIYYWKHLPTGYTGECTIYLFRYADIHTLLTYWTRGEWHYSTSGLSETHMDNKAYQAGRIASTELVHAKLAELREDLQRSAERREEIMPLQGKSWEAFQTGAVDLLTEVEKYLKNISTDSV